MAHALLAALGLALAPPAVAAPGADPCPAWGPPDVEAARALIDEALAADEEGRAADELEALTGALARVPWKDPDPNFRAARLRLLDRVIARYVEAGRFEEAIALLRCLRSLPDVDPLRVGTIDARIETLTIELDRLRPWLLVDSSPAGALVELDGEALGTTPWRGRALPGVHRIEAMLADHLPVDRVIEVVAGRPNDVFIELMRPAFLRVDAAGPEWRVRIGDGPAVPLPVAEALRPGRWRVVFEHADRGPQPPVVVQLGGGEVHTLAPPRLAAPPPSGAPAVALVAIGGGLLATGGVLALLGARRHDEADRIEATGGPRGSFNEAIDDGNALYVGGLVSAGLGLAAGAIGLALWPDDPPASTAGAVGWRVAF